MAYDSIKKDKTTLSLNGSQTVFNIPHGIGKIPTSFSITFGDARDSDLVNSRRTIDATNITITCDNPPAAGSVVVYWQAYA